jgi:hypothetical protein
LKKGRSLGILIEHAGVAQLLERFLAKEEVES